MEEGGMQRDFGDYFRNARMEHGISQESLSKLTKIPLYHIVSLENSDHEALPECVYVKGFIAACCGVLGLKSEEMAAFYMERRRLYLQNKRVKKSGWAYRKTALLIILLLLCIYAFNLYLDTGFFVSKIPETTASVETQSEEIIPAIKEKEIILTLQGKDTALVKMIIDGDIPKKIDITKGIRFDFTAKRNFNLLIENPKNVEISFNGKPYVIPGNDQTANVFFP
ncbi:helix-turn-helix domain-containing protein [Desulforegula conservatrix]|uniref:helix-turn-helix domain-containing protein n=1 Tax=Desulforegula conservatrix TaxID=153026 RepID=UPI000401A6FF|nr:helix-turn-helix domain-containing protein [Desulforegula conservatrix]